MLQSLFNSISSKEKTDAVKNLFENSIPSKDFFLMIVLSVLMATFGLLTNSSAVIVGSMLVAPILYPILSVAMGIIMSDFSLIRKSCITLCKAMLVAILVSTLTTLLFFSQAGEYTEEILLRTEPTLISVAIGAVAGLAAAFALVKPKLNETLPGVAISVALIPPLAVVGIGLARLDMHVILSSLLLFFINAVGVIVTATIVFSLMNFYMKRAVAKQVVKKEEKKLEEENHEETA